MILLISLLFDMALFTVRAVRKRSAMLCLRFFTVSILINRIAYFMILGLTSAFGENVLFSVVCTAAAKIFVFWLYLQSVEPKRKDIPACLLALLLSPCFHGDPASGLIGETILLLFVIYSECHENTPSDDKIKTRRGQESDLYLKTIEDSYRKNRALMHDLKNHIIALRSLAEKREYEKLLDYTDSMAEKISENLFPVHSGNIVLDALLADKYHTARRNGIFVEFRSVRYNADFDSGDLCTVIGNLFDNAIAENLRTTRAEERRISVFLCASEEEMAVEIKNPLFHTLNIRGGLPVSDKPDSEHHGIGLKNVRRVCDAYDGTLLWDDTDGIFTVTVKLKMTRNP